MLNHQIKRFHIESLILSCFINQNRTLELDKMEFEAYKLPFELFKANLTTQMVSKAIRILQDENKPVDEVFILDFIQSKTNKLNTDEFLQVSSYTWCSYETMISYLNQLKEIDREENKRSLLNEL